MQLTTVRGSGGDSHNCMFVAWYQAPSLRWCPSLPPPGATDCQEMSEFDRGPANTVSSLHLWTLRMTFEKASQQRTATHRNTHCDTLQHF